MDSKEVHVLRNMALTRAIGELESALYATYNENFFKEILKPNIEKAIELIKDCR